MCKEGLFQDQREEPGHGQTGRTSGERGRTQGDRGRSRWEPVVGSSRVFIRGSEPDGRVASLAVSRARRSSGSTVALSQPVGPSSNEADVLKSIRVKGSTSFASHRKCLVCMMGSGNI